MTMEPENWFIDRMRPTAVRGAGTTAGSLPQQVQMGSSRCRAPADLKDSYKHLDHTGAGPAATRCAAGYAAAASPARAWYYVELTSWCGPRSYGDAFAST